MYRYISLVWNEADHEVTETAKFLKGYFECTSVSWERAYEGRGLLVLHTGEEKNRMQAYPLNTHDGQSSGVILGKLFKRERNSETIAKNADLNTTESRKVIHTAGRHLVDDYWGSYVSFFQEGHRKFVLLDPIGILPCYRTFYRGVEIYFTYMPDVASCTFLNFSVDWAVAAKLMINRVDHTKAPINEIVKILPGQCLTITPEGTKKTFYWNPQKISQTDVIEDLEEAARTLRQTIISTVAAMTEPYDNVIHQIGGLDSSILLAALSKVPTPLDVTCLNLYHETPAGDERYFVRKSAAHVGVPLIEYKSEVMELNFQDISDIPITISFDDYFQAPKFKKFMSNKLHETGAQAMVNGTGGDEILYINGKNFAPIDYIKMHGIRPPFFRILMEAARMQKRSIWAILPKILKGGFGRDRFDTVSPLPNSLLTTHIREMMQEEAPPHPWSEFRDSVTPGKVDHIEPLVYGHYNENDPVKPGHHFTTLYPCLTQPVIETCLRIPIWVMMTNGKNRGLARKAFKNHLPQEVIWRASKSGGINYLKYFIMENKDVIRAMLMDGEMVKANVIDRQILERILHKSHDIEDSDFSFLFLYFGTELWARKLKGETFNDYIQSNVA